MIRGLLAKLALPVISAVVLSLGACSADAPRNGPALQEGGLGPAQLPIEVRASVTRASYLPGETVEFQISLRNATSAPVTIHSFPPAVDIIEPIAGASVYSFPAGSGETTLAPGAETIRSLAWTQMDSNGRAVEPGHYAFKVGLYTDRMEYGWRSLLTSGQQDSIFIAHPGGELIRTLAPDLSQDVGGVRITLDRLEFSATATTVHVRVIPPGYDFPEGRDEGPVGPPMSIMPFNPEASYKIDDGLPKPGGGGGFQPRQHDVQITWTLDPVPASTHLFRFVVTSLKKFDGPWAFTLDLTLPR